MALKVPLTQIRAVDEIELREILNKYLLDWVKSSGLSNVKFAEKTGLHDSNISNVNTKDRDASLYWLLKCAIAFEIPMSRVLLDLYDRCREFEADEKASKHSDEKRITRVKDVPGIEYVSKEDARTARAAKKSSAAQAPKKRRSSNKPA